VVSVRARACSRVRQAEPQRIRRRRGTIGRVSLTDRRSARGSYHFRHESPPAPPIAPFNHHAATQSCSGAAGAAGFYREEREGCILLRRLSRCAVEAQLRRKDLPRAPASSHHTQLVAGLDGYRSLPASVSWCFIHKEHEGTSCLWRRRHNPLFRRFAMKGANHSVRKLFETPDVFHILEALEMQRQNAGRLLDADALVRLLQRAALIAVKLVLPSSSRSSMCCKHGAPRARQGRAGLPACLVSRSPKSCEDTR